jgi:hypothetical protein
MSKGAERPRRNASKTCFDAFLRGRVPPSGVGDHAVGVEHDGADRGQVDDGLVHSVNVTALPRYG